MAAPVIESELVDLTSVTLATLRVSADEALLQSVEWLLGRVSWQDERIGDSKRRTD
jgi:hypothetical protein